MSYPKTLNTFCGYFSSVFGSFSTLCRTNSVQIQTKRFFSAAQNESTRKKAARFRYYFFAKPITFTMIGIFAWDGYVLHQSQTKERKEFVDGSTEAIFQNSLRTGDIVIFQNSVMSTQHTVGKMLLLMVRRSLDHVGIVIRDIEQNGEDTVPYILEKTFGGYQLLPFDERILNSSAHTILVRQLKGKRDSESLEQIQNFIKTLNFQTPSQIQQLSFLNYYKECFLNFNASISQYLDALRARIWTGSLSRVDFLSEYLMQQKILSLANKEEKDEKDSTQKRNLNVNTIEHRIRELERVGEKKYSQLTSKKLE